MRNYSVKAGIAPRREEDFPEEDDSEDDDAQLYQDTDFSVI